MKCQETRSSTTAVNEFSDPLPKHQPRRTRMRWMRDNDHLAPWISAFAALVLLVIVFYQTTSANSALRESTENFNTTIELVNRHATTFDRLVRELERPQISFAINLEEFKNESEIVDYRIVMPLAITGTTQATNAIFKNYKTTRDLNSPFTIDSIDVVWEERQGHDIGTISPGEINRRLMGDPLSNDLLVPVAELKSSLFIVGRLEYCDIWDSCYFYMRCARIGASRNPRNNILSYCGTRSGELPTSAPEA